MSGSEIIIHQSDLTRITYELAGILKPEIDRRAPTDPRDRYALTVQVAQEVAVALGAIIGGHNAKHGTMPWDQVMEAAKAAAKGWSNTLHKEIQARRTNPN